MKWLALLACSILASCSITREVQSIDSSLSIGSVALEHNTEVHMAGLHPEIVSQLEVMGLQVTEFTGTPPADADCVLRYTANWGWDLAMYLTFFRIDAFKNETRLGSAQYDARFGGLHMGKFGATAEKLRPLLQELFGRPVTPVER
ncbi:MAG: Sbal_3080 family lipoprotein [bacterium]|jgi:hypothetical protein|nr:hypothetical protein [Planctomycetota bacterium]HIL50967.1 hypothetical protein [Planctomycetota bacterium]